MPEILGSVHGVIGHVCPLLDSGKEVIFNGQSPSDEDRPSHTHVPAPSYEAKQ